MVRCLPRARAWPAVWLSLAVSTAPAGRRVRASHARVLPYSGGALGCLDVELLETPLDPGARVSGAARRDGGRGRLCRGVRTSSQPRGRRIKTRTQELHLVGLRP